MSRRIDIELTSTREDGSWTWRAAGAREPRGTLEGDILPSGAEVGSVLRAEVEGFLDGLSVVAVLPPRAPRNEPERLELKSSAASQPLVTSTLAATRPGERGRRNERGRDGRDRREGREGAEGRRERRGPRDRDRDRDRDRSAARHERPARPAPPPVETKPKPKRLRPGKAHRTALLEAVPAEQRPIAEQLLAGGIPSVRQAIDKQNAELKAEGRPEVKPDALLRVAEDLRPKALAAVWRDRAEAAVAVIDELDLRDLRSVVNAAGDAGRDEEARALAANLREALTMRVEKEQADWLTELAETVKAGRVVRALRLSSRPPKAGAPIPGDIATQLAEATAASLTDETGPDRWATVLDALAYSPVRRRVIPQSLPAKLSPDLRATIARLASRLPDIAHIFDIEPDLAAERAARGQARRRPERKDGGRKEGGRKAGRGARKGGDGARKGEPRKPKSADKPAARPADARAARAGGAAAATSAEVPAAETGEAAAKLADTTAGETGDASAATPAKPGDGTAVEPAGAPTSAGETAGETGDAPTFAGETAAGMDAKAAADETPAAEATTPVDTATREGEPDASTGSGEAETVEPTEDSATEADTDDEPADTDDEPAATDDEPAATEADTDDEPAATEADTDDEPAATDDEPAATDDEPAATEADTDDEPAATNGRAAAGGGDDLDKREAGADETAPDEAAAEAQPQS